MEIMEKVAYLKGMADGLELDTKEGKLLTALIDALEDLALEVLDMKDTLDEVGDGLDVVSDDLEDVEKLVYGEDDEDEDEDDEYDGEDGDPQDCYATACPTCGETIYFDEDILKDGEVLCPNCGEKLKFETDGLEDDSDAPDDPE